MVKRTIYTEPRSAKLSLEQMAQGIKRLQRRVDELEQFDPGSITERFNNNAEPLEKAIDETLTNVFGSDTIEYNRYRAAADLDRGPLIIGRDFSTSEIQRFYVDGKERALGLLKQAMKGLQENIDDLQEMQAAGEPAVIGVTEAASNRVFVVHGHDEAALQTLARFLEKLKLEPVVLKEHANQGRTIIEKYEALAEGVAFAVVLLTPDDIGAAVAADEQSLRARQNVIFELGYFAGKLGRGRVCLLRKGKIEIPSDLFGVVYTDLDDGGGWKFELAKELKAAKLDFDMNKVFG